MKKARYLQSEGITKVFTIDLLSKIVVIRCIKA